MGATSTRSTKGSAAGKEPETGKKERKPKEKPVYEVLKLETLVFPGSEALAQKEAEEYGSEVAIPTVQAWVPIENGVVANNRKEAIELATANREDRDGTFAAVPTVAFKTLSRKTRTQVISEFS